jgi:hypothetical protein
VIHKLKDTNSYIIYQQIEGKVLDELKSVYAMDLNKLMLETLIDQTEKDWEEIKKFRNKEIKD